MQGTQRARTAYKAAIEVSFDGAEFRFRFFGKGFDADGNVTVEGPRNQPVHLVLALYPGDGIDDVWFPASANAALKVGEDPTCPPTTDNPQFADKKGQPSHPGARNDLLRVVDRMTTVGDYAYAVTVEALLPNGIIRQVPYDPMVANRPY